MPETINGFQILRKVAESNTAEIFHGVQLVGRGRGGDFALKVLRPEFARDALERSYLRNEYRVLRGLEHPNLVRIYSVELDVPRPHLVMELIPGPSLRDTLSRGQVGLRDALAWVAQAADGLACFHRHGFVHRDVKPQNIVVGENGGVRVIDFALARRHDISLGWRLVRRLFDRRRPGTWSYMAPEQIRNHRLSGQTDIYGLGVTLFETLAGQLPFRADSVQGLLQQHLYAPVPPLRLLRPDMSLGVDELVRAMLAKDPLDRPHGMEYVSGRLRRIAESIPATP